MEEVEWVKMRTFVRLSEEDFTDTEREREGHPGLVHWKGKRRRVCGRGSQGSRLFLLKNLQNEGLGERESVRVD